MATVKSTKTNKTAAKAPAQETAPTNTDHAQTIPPAEDTAAEGSTPEPAASPAHQPSIDTPTPEAGDDPGPNMTSHDYDVLHDSAKTLEPYVTSLRPIPAGLTPKQHVTAIIAGGVVGGMLARIKPYETLDLHKAAETVGMCAQLAEMILHLDVPMPEAPDNTEGI